MGPGRLRYRIILVAMVAAILGWVGYLIALSAF
jgi:preprotein translocase subunit Sss1